MAVADCTVVGDDGLTDAQVLALAPVAARIVQRTRRGGVYCLEDLASGLTEAEQLEAMFMALEYMDAPWGDPDEPGEAADLIAHGYCIRHRGKWHGVVVPYHSTTVVIPPPFRLFGGQR